MSALAVPRPTYRPAHRPTHRPALSAPRHLTLVGPEFVPAQAAGGAAGREQGTVVATRPVTGRPAVRLTARGRAVRAGAVLVLALGAAVGAGGLLGSVITDAQGYDGPVERVSVGAGDTVWAIAASSAAEGQDVREVVDEILRLNGLASGDVVAGQQLVVPAG